MSTQSKQRPVIFWFRRDLRLEDNTGLIHALKSGKSVLPVFIFDSTILDALADSSDMRVQFIHQQVSRIKSELESNHNASLHVSHGKPLDVFKRIIDEFHPEAVYTNEDYEPYARSRDAEIGTLLESHDIEFHLFKDQVIHAKDDVLKADGTPYTIFTPYSKKWLELLDKNAFVTHRIPSDASFVNLRSQKLLSLSDLGFSADPEFSYPSKSFETASMREYGEVRNIPSAEGTSLLGLHLRFGTISIRSLAARAEKTSAVFLNELIWREFFQQILWHFPDVVTSCFKPQYEGIKWRNNEKEFEAWCSGMTGFPMVDAGMRELNTTGLMHNRVRMVVASFLTKDLLIDWRWGEAYFAEKLLDYELASNNGNWQWAAGTGCDAAPYFRIFNPDEQARKFDPQGKYIRKWVPEIGTTSYPRPIVDHKQARERTLKAYKDALNEMKE